MCSFQLVGFSKSTSCFLSSVHPHESSTASSRQIHPFKEELSSSLSLNKKPSMILIPPCPALLPSCPLQLSLNSCSSSVFLSLPGLSPVFWGPFPFQPHFCTSSLSVSLVWTLWARSMPDLSLNLSPKV